MGAAAVTARAGHLATARPAFYARTGNLRGDLVALLHPPYTAWHLSYVVYGAALAPRLDWLALAGTLLAFFFGTGIAAHALDEWHGHPLGTRLGDGTLLVIAGIGIAGGGGIAALGASMLSPWVLAWAAAGTLLMVGYTLEWHRALHSDAGFALTWGAFPVLVGYWAQAGRIDVAAVFVALAATLLSLAQRTLSTQARFVRRRTSDATVHFSRSAGLADWSREQLLDTWEQPLKLLAGTVVTLAAGLLLMRI
ncbi:MAG: hypothetical protein C4558_00945 [Dehalococcoidia bacterium]|nr:MAG: hypothetical protein C4558_00945 [Dehalococcoidia bacterium]